ncbi:hypothetical protein IAT38_004040 [Cryptococcus sp. DSM 104549]
MSQEEKDALVAFVGSFKLSKPVTSFEQLSDGKALMEVMSTIDATHFKNVPSRGLGPAAPGSSSSENWVLRMNTLKRLYRLLLSFPLPAPHPSSLSLSTLPEPPFPTIAKSPESSEGTAGLLQVCRLCLAVGVWAQGNEKVIGKIQTMREEHMAQLMKSIEEVMASLPMEHQSHQDGMSSLKPSPDLSYSPPSSGLRAERDKLLTENDELRTRCEQMMEQVAEMTAKMEEIKEERDDVVERLASARGDTPGAGLRTSQGASASEVDRLRADLIKAEENLAHTEADLENQNSVVTELTKTVDELQSQASEAAKLKDQLEEYRHTSERLRKSENVIEKYRKKLDESASVRRELRNLEEENAALVNTNSTLEAELKRAGSSKTLLDNYKSQIEALEKRSSEQAVEITDLAHQLEVAQSALSDMEREYERDQEELQLHQERIKEIELGGGSLGSQGLKRQGSRLSILGSKTTLDDELGVLDEEGGEGKVDTKTDLRLRIRALQRELAESKSSGADGSRLATLETLLADANKSRDRYQADYLKAHRESLKLQATLEQIRSGRGGDSAQTATALRQRLNEVLEERDALLKDKQALEVAKEEIEKELASVKTDLSLVGKDQRDVLASLRGSVQQDASKLDTQVLDLKEQIDALKEKDRQHLEEIKKLLVDKVDLQAAGIDQRERALDKEKEFSDLRATMAANGVPPEAQQKLLDISERNSKLGDEVKVLTEKLQKAKAFIKNQDAMFKADRGNSDADGFEAAQQSYEAQIATLKDQLSKARSVQSQQKLEQQLMLSAWHELGQRTTREHIAVAGTRRSQPKPAPTSWLGRQRRMQESASFVR